MATKLVQPPIPSSHLVQSIPRTRKALKPPSTTNWTNPRSKFTRFEVHPFGISRSNHLFIRGTVEQSSGLLEEDDKGTIFQTKSSINRALGGTNRGVFGVTSAKRAEIEALVKQLESLNPTPNPTFNLEKIIDAAESKAVNVIKFSARGLNLLTGQLTIKASFSIVSASRVNIKYDNSNITPEQLMNVFRKNYDLLLSIFNPEGWLDITYVDDTMRIGRDDKGNIFILERSRDDQNEL